jgi:hypothetical protein
MTPQPTPEAIEAFAADLLGLLQATKDRDVRTSTGRAYRPTREHLNFRRQYGAGGAGRLLAWAKDHLRLDDPTGASDKPGFTAMLESNNPDLTWEAQVLKHAALFTERELAVARSRQSRMDQLAAQRIEERARRADELRAAALAENAARRAARARAGLSPRRERNELDAHLSVTRRDLMS